MRITSRIRLRLADGENTGVAAGVHECRVTTAAQFQHSRPVFQTRSEAHRKGRHKNTGERMYDEYDGLPAAADEHRHQASGTDLDRAYTHQRFVTGLPLFILPDGGNVPVMTLVTENAR